jgi:hypothetical protein
VQALRRRQAKCKRHAGKKQGTHWRLLRFVAASLQQIAADSSRLSPPLFTASKAGRDRAADGRREGLMLTMTFSPMSMRPSTVADPMCGSSTTTGARQFDELGIDRRLVLEHVKARTRNIAGCDGRTSAFSPITRRAQY